MPIESTSGSSVLSTALQGLKKELSSVAANAEKIANFGSPENSVSDESLVTAIVDLKQDVQQVKALRTVIGVSEELDDEVLNIIA